MLLEALRSGSLTRPELMQRVGSAYPLTDSRRRMIDRDLGYLRSLGIVVERSPTRPPRYTLRGGLPILNQEELRALALIRDTFGPHHPQTGSVQAVLDRLTTALTDTERRIYQQRQTSRTPVQPAIDYTPYAALIARLEEAISKRQVLAFHYQPSGGTRLVWHPRVEPYEVEYYERHYYLVAYSHKSKQTHDFRIDRIHYDETFAVLYRGGSAQDQRRTIPFRYRLAATVAQGGVSQRFEQQHILERLPNGDVIIQAEGRSDFFIVRTLLKYAHNAELLDPPWLRAKMVEAIRLLTGVYGLTTHNPEET